jgi:hypothetical protein
VRRCHLLTLGLQANTSQKLPEALALLGRFLCRRSKLDDLPALFGGNPFFAFPKAVRHVKLDYLCHSHPYLALLLFLIRCRTLQARRMACWTRGRRVGMPPSCRKIVKGLSRGKYALRICTTVIDESADSDPACGHKLVRGFRRARGARPHAVSHLRKRAQHNRRLGRR